VLHAGGVCLDRQLSSSSSLEDRMRHSAIAALFGLGIGLSSSAGSAQAQDIAGRAGPASRCTEELSGATLLGKEDFGGPTAYRKGDRFLLELNSERFGRLILWHVEAIEMPTQSLGHNEIGTTVVSLERRGGWILIRDRAPGFQKRAGRSASQPDDEGSKPRPADVGVDPIYRAIAGNTSAPIIAVIPIVCEGPNGLIVVDVTKLFSSDIETLSAKKQVAFAKMQVKSVEPARSFIKEVRAFPQNVSVKSQLTFLAVDAASGTPDPIPVTVGVGHWFVTLPEPPMPARAFDERVGFFQSKFTEFESSEDEAFSKGGVVWRHRLEKVDPRAAVSEPVKPIIFYVGREVPQHWRPYVRAGIELWRPAFEAAGFRNAIIARDAPSPEEDPNWAAEDARTNVVRWLPTETPNAIGPTIYDPRSGEIIGAHVQIFPRVLQWFSGYYYLMAKGVDPEVNGLPLSEQKQGELLTHIVAHEVGHALGLRHNHLASTAYSVADLRNPTFANVRGPNASIMAYGRMNQVAQPGDGVTRVLGGLGPYDYFAINWGYGVHGATSTEEQVALDRMAGAAAADPVRRWAAGEFPDEDRWKTDPRVLTGNVGRERLEATRLGIAKLVSSMSGLTAATGDNGLLKDTYDFALSLHHTLNSSLGGLIGGTLIEPNGSTGHPDVEEQRNAIRYAFGEGAQSLDVFLDANLVARAYPTGALRRISEARARIVTTLLNAPRLAAIEDQARSVNYSLFDYADDVTDAIWGDLSVVAPWRRDLQQAYLRAVEDLLRPVDTAAQKSAKDKLRAAGYSENYVLRSATAGGDTAFPAWAGEALPRLRSRLETAMTAIQDRPTRLHLKHAATRLGALLEVGTIAQSGSTAARSKANDGSASATSP
jgi:hypothetical protein